MTFPPAFWTWVKWKDAGAKGSLPPNVRAYYLAHGISRAPKAWQDRYLIHTGGTLPIPAPVDLAPVRNLLVFATVTDDAIREALTLPQRWKVLFSADDAYWPGQWAVTAARARGPYVWCDCRTTLPARAKQLVNDFNLVGWYGQGENAGEFDVCLAAGGNKAIVNLSALTPTQLLSVASGRCLVTNENYRNVHPAERPDWRNANQGIGGNCGAVYESASEGAVYTSAASQIRNGWFGYHDSWYVEGFQPQDWQALRALG